MKHTVCTFHILAMSLLIAHAQEPTPQQKLPDEALRLKAAYQQTVDHAIQPIRDRYIADLTRLLDQLTRAGRLGEALAIKSEIATLRSSSGPESFKGTRWDWLDSMSPGAGKSWVELNSDGSGKSGWDTALKWKVAGRILTIQQNDRSWHFEMDPGNKEGHTDPKAHDQEQRVIRFVEMLK